MQYIPDDANIIVGFKPAEVLRSKLTAAVVQHSGGQDSLAEVAEVLKEQTGLNFADVEEVVVFADDKEIERIEMIRKLRAVRQRVKLVGLAMHRFHDAYNQFPEHSGITGVPRGNLSWRVFLLPMLGYESLYYEFDLHAAWDSPQNLRLISQMPKEFFSEGVKEVGKTSIHVLGGKGTPFGGSSAVRLSYTKDGNSSTIMAVQAGPNTAEFWTKPGPLEINSSNPVSSLGDVGEEFCCGIMDGSVRYLKSDIAPEVFNALAGRRDGQQIPWDEADLSTGRVDRVDLPGILVRSARPLDRKAIISA